MSTNTKEYNQKYYEDHKQIMDAQNKKYYEEHKQSMNEYKKKYYEENKQKINYNKNKNKKREYKKRRPIIERFFDKVKVNKDTHCWEWLGYRDEKGYGMFSLGKFKEGKSQGYGMFSLDWCKTIRSTRFIYSYMFGPILDGLCVLHKCDNPCCVRPDHLFLGTNLDNTKDKEAKGRGNHVKGSQQGSSKLNEDLVFNILKDDRNNVIIAKECGVCRSTISRIKLRKSWRHV